LGPHAFATSALALPAPFISCQNSSSGSMADHSWPEQGRTKVQPLPCQPWPVPATSCSAGKEALQASV
jgi:hypothetical protein